MTLKSRLGSRTLQGALAATVLAGALVGVAAMPASARGFVSFGFGAPAYVAPAPVYDYGYAPPAYYAPPPAYSYYGYPAPYVAAPAVTFGVHVR